jgi:hypothetical protein
MSVECTHRNKTSENEMFKITDKAGYHIYASFSDENDAVMYAKEYDLVVVKIVFCNDYNSLHH